MPRKSEDDKNTNVVGIPTRPLPPKKLSKVGADIWVNVTSAMVVDWFTTDTIATLESYCIHYQVTNVIDLKIKEADTPAKVKTKKGFADLIVLIKLRGTQTRELTALARSMRITHQAKYETRSAASSTKKTPTKKNLWDK